MQRRCIAFVHAHPDDEALATGGTIARYADEGAHVCLITCTNGEEGEIADVPELGPTEEIAPRLGEVRREELIRACEHLGDIDLRMLGYHDSGMDGTPANDAPHAFVRQDLDAVVAVVSAIFEEVRPEVVVTYDELGGYGHPDHIRAHQAATLAAAATGVRKLYHCVWPTSMLRAARELFGEDFASEEDIERMGTPDGSIGAELDVTAWVERKFAALQAHRTQAGTIEPILALPPELRVLAFGREFYVRAGAAPPAVRETDLFA